MNPFNGKMIVTDLDGTLLDDKKHIPENNLEAIERFTAGGGLFAVATGRSVESARPYIAQTPGNLPAIVLNGGMLYDFDNDKIIISHTLPEISRDITNDIFENFPHMGVEAFQSNRMHVIRSNKQIEYHITLEHLDPVFVTSPYDVRGEWSKALYSDEPEEIDRLIDYLSGKSYDGIRFIRSTEIYYEMLPDGVSKGAMLRELCERVGILIEKTYAIGDYYNDTEMIAAAGTGCVTANAPEDMRAMADFVTCHSNDGAIYELIKKIESGEA